MEVLYDSPSKTNPPYKHKKILFHFSGPRGEIVVGGPLVANGYYNLPEKTAESFYEENGTKWFRTGKAICNYVLYYGVI